MQPLPYPITPICLKDPVLSLPIAAATCSSHHICGQHLLCINTLSISKTQMNSPTSVEVSCCTQHSNTNVIMQVSLRLRQMLTDCVRFWRVSQQVCKRAGLSNSTSVSWHCQEGRSPYHTAPGFPSPFSRSAPLPFSAAVLALAGILKTNCLNKT